jgi:hypothetical protein
VSPGGAASLSLLDPQAKARAVLGPAEFGSKKNPSETRRGFSIDLFDESETLVWRAP